MSAQHTAAPWRVRINPRHDPDTCDLSICGDIFVLADVNGPQYEHQEANAYLMAAAPDLLRCAQILAALDSGRGRTFPTEEDCAFARAAIARATPTAEGVA